MKLSHLISSVLVNNASVASNRSINIDIRKKDVKSFIFIKFLIALCPIDECMMDR